MTISNCNQVIDKFDPSELDDISERTLFYPCSGRDLRKPINLFVTLISDYWFADTGYFSKEKPDVTPLVFPNNKHFQFIGKEISIADLEPEDWIEDSKYRGIPPFILTERYTYIPSKTIITINRHRRRGPSALRNEVKQIGVFFYRRDSPEGSSTMWLTAWKKQIKKKTALPLLILEKLVDGGLIVTDGSMCEQVGNPYCFFKSAAVEVNKTGLMAKSNVVDPFGNAFEWIGIVDKGYDRATLVWKVTKGG